ncbi:hypothetical protein E7Z59_01215 [Robertkochia marina]|uniref:Uncharacterized protein n=1 Tax=Robertkochia marina TaxID=1227945 RepID=A0A4V3UYC1_9FLAO|nr:hypothetical protein [Robertkochia marina]THD68978.1 hypothetical protein E7Z59_01215 [Robertkochia marina]TRZ44799.1 hypothetical protein D3A96_07170 [Robertkochia marina]
MYSELVSIITSYSRMRQLAHEFEFGFEDELEIKEMLSSVDKGIDRFTGVLQQDCMYTAKVECLQLQLKLIRLGALMEEKVRAYF